MGASPNDGCLLTLSEMVVSRSQTLTGDSLVSSAETLCVKSSYLYVGTQPRSMPSHRQGQHPPYSFDRIQTKLGGVEILEWEQPFVILAKTCLLLILRPHAFLGACFAGHIERSRALCASMLIHYSAYCKTAKRCLPP